MERARSLPETDDHDRRAARDPDDGSGGAGLPFYQATLSRALPRYSIANVIAPTRTIGIGANTSLKVSFWQSTVDEVPQQGDPDFVGVSMRTTVAKAWCDATPSGVVSMLPFEGAHWRFERPLSFVQFYLPFPLLATICDAMFDRTLAHTDLAMSADLLDTRVRGVLDAIRDAASWAEPTNLLLDSWALILSETLLRRASNHGKRDARASCGKILGRGIARVVDYIEAAIDQDLRLTPLADVAAISVYHFARSFKETVGVSPHAYVLSRRIARARALISRGEDRLSQVALSCGFATQAHFTTAFQRSLGVTPGRYRRSVRL